MMFGDWGDFNISIPFLEMNCSRKDRFLKGYLETDSTEEIDGNSLSEEETDFLQSIPKLVGDCCQGAYGNVMVFCKNEPEGGNLLVGGLIAGMGLVGVVVCCLYKKHQQDQNYQAALNPPNV